MHNKTNFDDSNVLNVLPLQFWIVLNVASSEIPCSYFLGDFDIPTAATLGLERWTKIEHAIEKAANGLHAAVLIYGQQQTRSSLGDSLEMRALQSRLKLKGWATVSLWDEMNVTQDQNWIIEETQGFCHGPVTSMTHPPRFWFLEGTDGGATAAAPHQWIQCPLGPAASYLICADVRLHIPMTHYIKQVQVRWSYECPAVAQIRQRRHASPARYVGASYYSQR